MKYFYLALPFLILFDSLLNWSFLGIDAPIMMSFIFLVFIFFKTDFLQSLGILLFYFLLVKILSPMNFFEIALPYFFIFGFVFFLKKRILTETYFLYAVWASLLSFVFVLLQSWLYQYAFLAALRIHQIVELAAYAFLQGILTFFMFIVFDRVFARVLLQKKDLYA